MSILVRRLLLATVVLGLGLCGLAGWLSIPFFGTRDAAIWAGWLALVFALFIGYNHAVRLLLKGPIPWWKPAVVTFSLGAVSMVGMFAASGWLSDASRMHGYKGSPSHYWVNALMILGLLAPGGMLTGGLKRPTPPSTASVG